MSQEIARNDVSRRWSFAIVLTGLLAACTAADASAPTSVASDATRTLAGARLYVRGSSPARDQAEAWRQSRPADALIMDRIASQPVAKWLGGWSGDVRSTVRNTIDAAVGTTPVFVLYNIPHRDCGSYSAGGESSDAAYRRWVREAAAGLRAGAVVIIEPDALAGMDCLSREGQDARVQLLADAVSVMKGAGAIVYLDAGHPRWLSASAAAARLKRAGIDQADGFSLNVSNFVATGENVQYGEQLSALVGRKHFIIDTSRNGNGPAAGDVWCNPRGRAIGTLPSTRTGHALVDAFLWVKVPGESDGSCNGGPTAGNWWGEYALELARNAAPSMFASVANTMRGLLA